MRFREARGVVGEVVKRCGAALKLCELTIDRCSPGEKFARGAHAILDLARERADLFGDSDLGG